MLSIVIVTNTFLVSTTAWAAKTPTPKPTSPSNAESYQADANSTTVATSSSTTTTASSSATQSSSATATNPPSTAPYHHHHHHHHATVTVRYVDQTGKLLATGTADYPFGPFVGRPYTTHPQNINNYHFVRMGAGSLPATGILSHHGDNGIVTYVYAPAYHLTTKTINEYVEYVDENGKALANPYRAQPVTFATVADALHHMTVTYFSRTKTTLTLDQQGRPVDQQNWTRGNQATLAAIPNPAIKGYHVASNNAPRSSHQQVDQQTIDANSSDLHYTVRYERAHKKATVKFIDDRTHQELLSKEVSVYYNQANTYDPTRKIKEYESQGYTLTTNDFPKNGLDFDQINGDSVTYYVHLRSKKPAQPKSDVVQPLAPQKPSSSPKAPKKADPIPQPAPVVKPVQSHPVTVTKLPSATPTAAPLTMEEKRVIIQKRLQQHRLPTAVPAARPQKNVKPAAKSQAHIDFEYVDQPRVAQKRWIKIPSYRHRYWKFPTFTTTFALWNSELQPLYRKTGDDLHHTHLGLILRTMSGRMLLGQKYSK